MTETKYCSNCGAKIDKKAEICPKCGVRVMMEPYGNSLPQGPKNPGTSAVLSFLIPGLGQVYNGEVWKGLLIILGVLLNIFFLPGFLFFTLYNMVNVLLILVFIYLTIWVFAIYDAYNTAKKINYAIGVKND